MVAAALTSSTPIRLVVRAHRATDPAQRAAILVGVGLLALLVWLLLRPDQAPANSVFTGGLNRGSGGNLRVNLLVLRGLVVAAAALAVSSFRRPPAPTRAA